MEKENTNDSSLEGGEGACLPEGRGVSLKILSFSISIFIPEISSKTN
ncbi:MAG: hypothetical protein ACFCUU_01055 [Cyclobacteriaceae bacterium]